ncbi:hypothetical protein ACMGGD_27535 [Pseudomonas sp. BNK-6]|uniref:hypothetical protein n=1 Tax=unclassified Pseudomonas TaxID=196821 RepID=UPI003A8B17D7
MTREAAGVEKPDFQMRDLRAIAGTDKVESSGNIMQANDQLGHTTVMMTEQYIRNRKDKKVSPTKRIAGHWITSERKGTGIYTGFRS